jgi:2'-5' RNA ligase
MTRTFLALEMNTNLQSHLERVIDQVAQVLPDARWVNPAGIHLTLSFLGEIDDTQLAEAMQAAQAAAQQCHAFTYRLSRLGIFGNVRHPRVIWMGIEEPSGALNQVHRVLQQQLIQHGFEVDMRPFSPHLTLARVKAPLPPAQQQQLQSLLEGKQKGIVSPDVYAVRHIAVIKSELSRNGAKYTSLQEYQLLP